MLKLTATALPRFIQCNGSKSMIGFESDINVDNTVRDEGIAVHWIIEQLHDAVAVKEGDKAPNGITITQEMLEHAQSFIDYIGQNGEIEYDMKIQGENYTVSCRADHINLSADHLFIDDFKYGWSFVEPKENWTLLAYAIGYCIKNNVQPMKISMTIFQPRPYHNDGHVRTWTITYNELLNYYNKLNQILSNPTEELNTGSHCKNCKAISTCPAVAKAQLNAIDESEKLYEKEIDNDNLAFKLEQLERAKNILDQTLNSYTEVALHRIKNGQIVKGYNYENNMSNQVWLKNVNADLLKNITGEDLRKDALITPQQAIKAGVNEDVVNSLSTRHNKGLKLKKINVDEKAGKMFNNK